MAKSDKPVVQLTGENGNVFNLIAIAGRALRKAGFPRLEEELKREARKCRSYEEALALIQNYVEVE